MPVFKPEQFISESFVLAGACQPNHNHWISEAGGLAQFGVFVEELAPGSRSSLLHWHSAEDEMIYVLEGEITVIEGATETCIYPGCAATFRAGVAVGHYLENRSQALTRCLVVGTRAAVDTITYPERDRVCHRDRALPDDIWTDTAGNPASSPYRD